MNNNYGLVPLSQLDAKVAEGYTDIRGFTAYTDGGKRVGEVDQLLVDVSASRVGAITIDVDRDLLDTGREPRAQVPIESVEIETATRRVTIRGAGIGLLGLSGSTGGAAYASPAAAMGARDEARVVLSEEELAVGKRNVAAGEVDISKRVETEHVAENVTLRHDEVEIERRPITHAYAAADTRIGTDEEIRIPLMAEEAVVEKRVVPTEEIVVRKRSVAETETVETELRHEEADIREDVRTNVDDRGLPKRDGSGNF